MHSVASSSSRTAMVWEGTNWVPARVPANQYIYIYKVIRYVKSCVVLVACKTYNTRYSTYRIGNKSWFPLSLWAACGSQQPSITWVYRRIMVHQIALPPFGQKTRRRLPSPVSSNRAPWSDICSLGWGFSALLCLGFHIWRFKTVTRTQKVVPGLDYLEAF